ncbi:MAG: lipoprotein [Phenylobacterium sp.]
MRLTLALAALLAASALSACGKTGDLQRPGPLFGAGRNTTKDADEANRTQEPARPVNTVDPRERTSDPAPPRTLPIQGAPNDPTAAPPQGVIPDPYNNPRR